MYRISKVIRAGKTKLKYIKLYLEIRKKLITR